ncbi:MAG: AP2 domain-containing protein [Deinococcota bacterium]
MKGMRLFDEAYYAETFVERERGQWVVYMEVIFADEICRHRIGSYFSETRAKVAAHYMRESANINWGRPPTGL